MKRIIRIFIVETGALYIVTRIASGIVIERGLEGLLIAGAALTAMALFVKPAINLLLLPLNLVTLGLFRWVGQAIALYLVDLIVPSFSITGFNFAGFESVFISLPPLSLGNPISYVAFSFLLSLITTFTFWLIR